MKKIISILSLITTTNLSALKITEVFPGGVNFFDSEEKYIEIHNSLNESFNIKGIKIHIYTNTSEYIEIGLQNGLLITKEFKFIQNKKETISPLDTIILLSARFTNHIGLLPILPDTSIFFPDNETIWNTGWENRLEKIEILYNGTEIFDTGKIDLKKKENLSHSLKNFTYIYTGLSPGNPEPEFLSSSNLIVKSGEEVIIYSSSYLNGQINISTSQSCYRDSINIFKEDNTIYARWTVPFGLKNGENIFFDFNNRRLLIRYIDWNSSSKYYERIFINEVVADPKVDYSGGNWTGKDGGGTINSTDDWIEILNISTNKVDLNSLFVLEKTNVKKLKIRTNTSSSNSMLSEGIAIVSPEDGLSEKANLYLFENHPYKGGQIIDYIEYGKDFDGDGICLPPLSSTSAEEESLSRIIQGTQKLPYVQTFKKTKASFAKINSFDRPYLFLLSTNNILTIFLYENSENISVVKLKNELDEEDIKLEKNEFYFYKEIKFTEKQTEHFDGTLSTGKGTITKIIYKSQETNWQYVSEGWKMPEDNTELENIVIYPNPLEISKKKLKFSNLPKGVEIFCLDNKGNILKTFKSEEKYL